MEHGEDPFDELIDVCDLVQMSPALLCHPEDAQADKVGALAEDVGQLQQRRVYQDGKWVLREEAREAHDGFALFAQTS